MLIVRQKIFPILYPPLENSTTRITILQVATRSLQLHFHIGPIITVGGHPYITSAHFWTLLDPPTQRQGENPITAMGRRQCLPLSVVHLKGKHCWHPIFVTHMPSTRIRYSSERNQKLSNFEPTQSFC